MALIGAIGALLLISVAGMLSMAPAGLASATGATYTAAAVLLRPDHDGAHHRTPDRAAELSRRQRLYGAGVLRLGDGNCVQGDVHAERRQVDDRPDDDGLVPHPDLGSPAQGRGPLQRHRGRRVDERLRRRVSPRLGLPQSGADAGRVRLRGGVRAGPGGERRQADPRLAAATGLVGSEPARYGSLHHPGDQYALDMFAQIGRPVGKTSDAVLGNLHPKHMVAVGESQSAFYLTTFADALQPLTNTFDGIFIHSRGGSGAPLNGSLTKKQGRTNLRIRTDLKRAGLHVRDPDRSHRTRLRRRRSNPTPAGSAPGKWRVRRMPTCSIVGAAAELLGCTTPVNDGPQHYVVQAAFSAFMKWVAHGTPPPSPPPSASPAPIRRRWRSTANGNVIGGVRTPAVDVPVSTLSGAAPTGASALCSLFGSTTPFSPPDAGEPLPDQEPLPRPVSRPVWTRPSPAASSFRRTGRRCWRRPSRSPSPRRADASAAEE